MAITGSAEQFVRLPSGIELCYQTFGDRDDPTILLIMGLGGPMGWWSTELCSQLAQRGFFVIRYDNRDTGRSTKLREHPVTKGDIVRAYFGRGSAPYDITDLADDAIGLIDALELDQVHVVGISMGGMIAQTLVLAHQQRFLTLTSIMSTTGRRSVGWQHPKVIPGLFASAGRTRESYVQRSVKGSRRIGSRRYRESEFTARARAIETYDRGWSASGVGRQLLAVVTQLDRTAALAQISIPTMVIHGLADPLVDKSGGRATAAAIVDAELVEIRSMGHDLPQQLYGQIINAIVRNTLRSMPPNNIGAHDDRTSARRRSRRSGRLRRAVRY